MKLLRRCFENGRFIPLYLLMVLALMLSACDVNPGAGTELGEVEPTEVAEGEMVDEELADEDVRSAT